MKKFTLSVLFILSFSFVVFAQTSGVLSVSVTTSEAGGYFAPANVVAIWIEDDAGNFVKTLLAYAQSRITHLNTWQAATAAAGSEYNTTDAITGATKTSHATRTCSWDGTDYLGASVTDGTYNLHFELSDKNSTGNNSDFSFVKGPNSDNQTPSNAPSFSSITIDWEPTGAGIQNNASINEVSIYPNPGTGKYIVSGDIVEIEIRNILGELIYSTRSNEIDINNFADGTYLAFIRSNDESVVRKLIKR